MKQFFKSPHEIENQIEAAFGWRTIPKHVIKAKAYPDDQGKFWSDIAEDAYYFTGRDWRGMTCEEFESRMCCFAGFIPPAYCYYLPGVMTASIRTPHLPLEFTLDQHIYIDLSQIRTHDSVRYLEKFILLTRAECIAVKKWMLWLVSDVDGLNPLKEELDNLDWLLQEYDSEKFKKLRAATEAETYGH